MSNHLIGHIWNLLMYIIFQPAADVPEVFWTWKTLTFCSTSLWNDHISYNFCIGTFLQDTTFYVLWNTTFGTSISSLMCLACIKSFLIGWLLIIVFDWVPLLTDLTWSELVRLLFPLAFVWWEVCSLMPQKINLSSFGVTCNFFYVPSGRLWGFHFFGKLPHLACWEFV